jgi:5'-deoxynucleotidase YfbR-like HD superfamily hydrolase
MMRWLFPGETNDWFVTASGLQVYVTNPGIYDIHVVDIGHALAHICRFGGHTRNFYSVAQHSVLVSHLVPPSLAFEGLLHDASEAYLGDVIHPLKALLPKYKRIERRWEDVIARKFGLQVGKDVKTEIKRADLRALATERRDLIVHRGYRWRLDELGYEPAPDIIRPLFPEQASNLFLDRFEELYALRGRMAA